MCRFFLYSYTMPNNLCPLKGMLGLKSKPRVTWSMKRWKLCAAFLSPKGIRTNSKRPNGVMTAVFGMSKDSTGIWWQARTKSTLEKIVAPSSVAVNSCMWGMGYQSGTVLCNLHQDADCRVSFWGPCEEAMPNCSWRGGLSRVAAYVQIHALQCWVYSGKTTSASWYQGSLSVDVVCDVMFDSSVLITRFSNVRKLSQ